MFCGRRSFGCDHLAAKDCYTIGKDSYNKENWQMSRDWMKEALNKYDEGERVYCN